MNFISREISLFIFIMQTRWLVWIIPVGYFFFCMILKLYLLNALGESEQNNTPNQLDIFGPLISAIQEKFINKINKIAIIGSGILFFIAYKNARRSVI